VACEYLLSVVAGANMLLFGGWPRTPVSASFTVRRGILGSLRWLRCMLYLLRLRRMSLGWLGSWRRTLSWLGLRRRLWLV
jgi:hypothetical protein